MAWEGITAWEALLVSVTLSAEMVMAHTRATPAETDSLAVQIVELTVPDFEASVHVTCACLLNPLYCTFLRSAVHYFISALPEPRYHPEHIAAGW